jgi:hypothetical protein
MRRKEKHIGYWWEGQKKKTTRKIKDHPKDRVVWSGLMLLRMGTREGSCESGNEPSGSVKCWEILKWLRDERFLKKGSVPWSLFVS